MDEKEQLSTPVVSQQEHYLHPVTIRELSEQRHRFNIDPPFQRKKAWRNRQCQQLYETILLGRSIGILEGYKETDEGEGGTIYSLIDGHQRITALLEFVDNRIKTWTHPQKLQVLPNGKPPVEPGKFFKQMGVPARNYFLDYRVHINIVPRGTELERVERFLGIQCQTPLTPAERLYAYPSLAKDLARKLSKHTFWEDFYKGETNRGQLFQSSLYLLTLEMASGGLVDLGRGAFVAALASGKYDAELPEMLENTVSERLDDVACVFAGMQFTDRAAVIAMYQAVLFLKQAGYTIRSMTDRGKLAPWITVILAESKHVTGDPVYHQPVQKLLYASGQRTFWEKHLKTVQGLLGVQATV